MIRGLGDLLSQASQALVEAGTGFALVGGLAVSARTEPRFTRDIDLVVAVDGDGQAEALVRAVCPPWTVISILEHDGLHRLATARLGHQSADTTSGPVLDLLFASSGIEAEIVAAADPIEVLPGVTVPVATVSHLIALKMLAESEERPQDRVDLHALVKVASHRDRQEVIAAVERITARGAHRDRDLLASWHRLSGG
ncbi:nucleotidyl transferase AbiEii/AbiGii toxin family protein [soil metagenome]